MVLVPEAESIEMHFKRVLELGEESKQTGLHPPFS